jgi:hypothetical protein
MQDYFNNCGKNVGGFQQPWRTSSKTVATSDGSTFEINEQIFIYAVNLQLLLLVVVLGASAGASKRLIIGGCAGGGAAFSSSTGFASGVFAFTPPLATVFCFFFSSSRAAFSASSRSRWICARLLLNVTCPATNCWSWLGRSRSSSSAVPSHDCVDQHPGDFRSG